MHGEQETHACCAPSFEHDGAAAPAAVTIETGVRRAGRQPGDGPTDDASRHTVEQVALPGGVFRMGDAHGDGHPGDGEGTVHEVELEPFTIDATSVTNADFARFVADTGYRTEAEQFGFSAVFHLALQADRRQDVVGRPPDAPWWLGVREAGWRRPGGRHSSVEGKDDHPVVHVSWNDAQAYCEWAGRRLPTEAEWEYASRGGLTSARYPWGDELDADHGWRCNIWQGPFPRSNTEEDGYLTTAPVRTYRPNDFGLWQTVGNVWEWCGDWFSPNYYDESPRKDPQGPAEGTARVMRGGSFLCHDSYCNRYRNAARSSNTPDSSMVNGGFRTVAA
ncbi:formylglycine-generating enzyme family protein [Georgenia halophila]|uniref:Formylglycine-generating enzyme family protein n=1 Tax=Georgenia halophila TaxID=620889 RepID=A0ABP8LLN4_9MICO